MKRIWRFEEMLHLMSFLREGGEVRDLSSRIKSDTSCSIISIVRRMFDSEPRWPEVDYSWRGLKPQYQVQIEGYKQTSPVFLPITRLKTINQVSLINKLAHCFRKAKQRQGKKAYWWICNPRGLHLSESTSLYDIKDAINSLVRLNHASPTFPSLCYQLRDYKYCRGYDFTSSYKHPSSDSQASQ